MSKTGAGEHRLEEIHSFQIKQHRVIAHTYCGCEIGFPIGAHATLRVYPFAQREKEEVAATQSDDGEGKVL